MFSANTIIPKAGMPAGEFQDVEGETEERRRARLERQQRTQERAVCDFEQILSQFLFHFII